MADVNQAKAEGSAPQRCRGTVKWYDEDKGFGFIEQKAGPDVFLHARDLDRSQVMDEIRQGDELEFDAVSAPKGLRASNIKLLTA